MKNEKGEINLIALIFVLLVLIAVLIVLLIFRNIFNKNIGDSQRNSNVIENHTNRTSVPHDESNNNTVVDTNENNKKENHEFTYSFLNLENNKKNMIYSPLSIKYALSMLKEGANENTLKQINNVIGNLSLPKYKSYESVLSMANGLFIKDIFYPKVKQTYMDTLKEKYNADVEIDEFKSANNINNWIENNTLGIIKNLLKDEMFENKNEDDDELVMLLINALAIDMEWQEQFAMEETWGADFNFIDGKKDKVTMMHNKTFSNGISYYLGNDVKALTMDLKEYDGNKFEFMAIMPESNLDTYIGEFTDNKLNMIDKNLKPASKEKDGVIIKIPKFSFEYDLKLKEDLQNLGIKDAFDRKVADFTGMANINNIEEKLYVSDAIHKAKIDFTEKGVKAAAVTVFSMAMTSAIEKPTYPIEITIDKPFLFLIRDKNTNEIWFVGTVYEPNLWENDKVDYQGK